jgi:hypothetical protein
MKALPAAIVGISVLVCTVTALDHQADADETAPRPTSISLPVHAEDRMPSSETTFLPTDDLFKPLLADPKEPRFYFSYRLIKYKSEDIHSFIGGYGEIFGLYRYRDNVGGYSWQANFGGGIHAQFDLDAPSFDLVNADYTIGFPFTFRKGNASCRFSLYHQSSHLGDEYLLRNNVERLELSYEALSLIGSYEWKRWRAYYGGEYIIHQGPTDIKPAEARGGIEYYAVHASVGQGRLVGGWDLMSAQEHGWSLNSSIKAGLQFDSSSANKRYIRVLAEGYKGFSPYGQFYLNPSRMTYAGIGIYLGFE